MVLTRINENDDRELLLPTPQTEDHLVMDKSSDQVIIRPPTRDNNNVVLQWKNISVGVRHRENCITGKVTVPNKPIISKVSGIALPGSLLAIMGASGSGKTTLLNALTLRSQSHLMVEGKILVNGKNATPGKMDAISAYVQQDDLFFGQLTVKEQLNFHALLRMDRSITKEGRFKRVQKVISELGLSNCQDTLIGVPGRIQGISGGERRRLAFAAEVLSDPPLLFCDEPTSGLDASMAQSVVVLLRKLAAKGKTILCTIHQPSSYQYVLFDRIMLMAEGKLAFLGTSDEALTFFSRLEYACPENCSPADHFIHVLSTVNGKGNNGNTITKICKAFALSKEGMAVSDTQSSEHDKLEKFQPEAIVQVCLRNRRGEFGFKESSTAKAACAQQLCLNCKGKKATSYKASLCMQLQSVLWRTWLGVVRDPKIVLVKVIINVLMPILMGSVYWNQKKDQLGVFNMNSFFALFLVQILIQNVTTVIHVFSEEMPLFLREQWNGMYGTGVYVATKSIANMPEFVVLPLIQTLITFSMIGMTDSWQQLLIASCIVVLVANASASYGYFMSSINSSLGGAVGLIPFMVGPLITVSGYFINKRSIPWYFRWVHHVSMFKYGTEALTINQWKDVTYIECNLDNSTCPRSGSNVLQFLDYDTDNIPTDIIALVILTVAFRLLATVILSIQAWRSH